MESGLDWDSEKMLDVYIYDYMVKKNLHEAAEIFARDANVCNNAVVINEPYGFLTEWWTMFWSIYSSRVLESPQAMENSNVKPTQMMENKQQIINHRVPNLDMNQQSAMQFSPNMNFNKTLVQPGSSLEASRLPVEDFNPDLHHCNVGILTPSKPSSSHASHFQQQVPKKSQQQNSRESSSGVNLGRYECTDTTLCGIPKPMLPRAGLHDAGLGKGANQMLLNGWSMTECGQSSPSASFPVLNSLLPVSNQQQQFPTSIDHHQQDLVSHVIAKAQVKKISVLQGSTNNLGNLLCTDDTNGTDGQAMVPRRQTSEQRISVPIEQTAEQKRVVRMGQNAEQQQNDQQTQQQLPKSGRKRKNLSASQAVENSLDGNDTEVEKPSDLDMESLLFHDDDNTGMGTTSTSFRKFQRSSTPCGIKDQKGFSFEEVASVNSSNGEILCCHFSTDGQFVASAGHERKVLLWRMSSFDFVDTAESHSHIISDIRFRPNSSTFATSSFDKTVQIWDANKPSKSLFKLLGHTEQVTSLDFHPRKMDVLCSCDSNDEIRLWNFRQFACTRIFKGATRQVRFQPQFGNLLAAASGNRIGLFEVETNSLQCYLEGHTEEVRSICWDSSGRYLASVSEDSARVWAVLSGGKCIYELHSIGNKYESCTFHPVYSLLVVIGSYKSIILWNPTDRSSKPMTVATAHNGIVSALADCPQSQMIASVSHDQCVKLWR